MRLVRGALLVALCAVPAAEPATAAPEPTSGTVYVVRSARGAGPLTLTVRAVANGPYGVVMSAIVPRGRTRPSFVTFTEFGASDAVDARSQDTAYSTCALAASTCGVVRSGPNVTLDLGGAKPGDTVVVGVVGTNVRFQAGRHWSVKPTSSRIRVANGASTATWAGARPMDDVLVRAERFSHAATTGGRYGSVAFSAIPCDAAGSGSAQLRSGNATVVRMDCTSLYTSIDVCPRRCTWSLSGDVTGVTGIRTRLAVIDLVGG